MKKKPKILVIDDDLQTGRTIKNFLTSQKMDVCLANRGAQGIEKALENKPDLIICEINMTPIDGFHIFNVVKEAYGEGKVPFIIMSNRLELRDIRTIMNMGADDLILKPILLGELQKSVDNQLMKMNRVSKRGLNEFNALFNLSPDGIFLLENNAIIDVNQAFLKMFDIKKSDLRKFGIEYFFDKDSLIAIKDAIQHCINGFGSRCVEKVFIQTKPGILREASFSVATCERSLVHHVVVGLVIPAKIEKVSVNNEQSVSEVLKMLKKENINISVGVAKRMEQAMRLQDAKIGMLPCDIFSKRENEVLNLSLKGLPTKQIADQLFISDRTVEKYRSKLMEKTGSNNIIEVIHYAVRNKLVNMSTYALFCICNIILAIFKKDYINCVFELL
jgi:DNA-binding NarL/FixJ family response regulator